MKRAVQIRRGERGFNLIEVIIAMALLSVVIISIMGLFVMGRKNVYSGKQMTQAVTVGNRVMETMSALDRPAIVTAFGLPTTGAGASVTVNGVTYANSFLRQTTNITGTNDVKGYLLTWRNDLTNNKRFNSGVVSLIFTPTLDTTNNPAQMGTCSGLRVRAVVTWREGLRNRNVTLDTVKIFRQ